MLLFALNDGNAAIHFIRCQSAAQQGAQQLSTHPELQCPSLLLLAVPFSWYLVRFGEKGIHRFLLQHGDIRSHPDVIIMITLLHSDKCPPFMTLWEPTMWFLSLLCCSAMGNPVHLWPHLHHTTAVLLPFWMLTCWPYYAVIVSSVALFDLIYHSGLPVQDKSSAHQDSSELPRNFGPVFCTILRRVAWPALFIIMAACSWHKMIEFDSTLALPRERRSASEPQFYGYRLCAYTNITPTMQILYVVSIGWRHVPFHLLVWWPWLLPVSCFAARLCHCTSLVVNVEGHRQTCLPPKKSLTSHCIIMTICSLSLKAWCWKFLSFTSLENLPWSIFHARLSLSFLWARHNTSKPLTYSVLP